MVKAWWLGFPRFRCPHCGRKIEGVKFAGTWQLPPLELRCRHPRVRAKKEVTGP